MVAARRLAYETGLDKTAPITNIVFMGMGEPLANLPAVLRSLPILTHALGLHFSHNKARAPAPAPFKPGSQVAHEQPYLRCRITAFAQCHVHPPLAVMHSMQCDFTIGYAFSAPVMLGHWTFGNPSYLKCMWLEYAGMCSSGSAVIRCLGDWYAKIIRINGSKPLVGDRSTAFEFYTGQHEFCFGFDLNSKIGNCTDNCINGGSCA